VEDEAPVSEEAVLVWWTLYRSRNHKGKPRLTEASLADQMKLRRRDVRNYFDELKDAGFLQYDQFGHPEFPSSDPPGSDPFLDYAPALAVGARSLVASGLGLGPIGPGPMRAYAGQLPSQQLEASSIVEIPKGISHNAEKAFASKTYPRWIYGTQSLVIYNLAELFAYRVRKHYTGMAPHPTNEKAVRGQIRRWVKVDGIAPTQVFDMINLFVTSPQFIRKGVPAWKSFIMSRQRLLNLVQDRQQRQASDSVWKRAEK
jgi:hypothetical protein